MKSVSEQLGEDLNVNAAFRQIIAGEPERVPSPAIGQHAIRESALLRESIFKILLAYDSVKEYENVTVPGALVNAIEAARKVVK